VAGVFSETLTVFRGQRGGRRLAEEEVHIMARNRKRLDSPESSDQGETQRQSSRFIPGFTANASVGPTVQSYKQSYLGYNGGAELTPQQSWDEGEVVESDAQDLNDASEIESSMPVYDVTGVQDDIGVEDDEISAEDETSTDGGAVSEIGDIEM